MCTTETKRVFSRLSERLENARYRKYAEAKAKIAKDLSPKEYEEEVKRIAKRYGI